MKPDQDQLTRTHIRSMIRRDWPEVLAIEAASFKFPWREEDFTRCLRTRNVVGVVAERNELIAGFMIYALSKHGIELLDLATARDMRRRGVATHLVGRLKRKLKSSGRTRIFFHVLETNLEAQLFFRHAGFRAVAVQRGFYDERPEDAYLMEYWHVPDDTEES